jgi:hypothetical protein
VGGAQQLVAADWLDGSWIRSYTQAYRDPANYPGRSVYPGSRFGFSGYTRPLSGTDPYPRTMWKVAPPTMYHWSKTAPRTGPGFYDTGEEHAPVNPAYDYYAE